MQKNFKDDFETKYNDIFRNLYVQWKLQSKKKYEELQEKGLANSGVESKSMYMLIEELINKTINELHQLFITLPEKYNRKISLKDLEKHREKTKNNINGHINNMENELKKGNNAKIFLEGETYKIFLNNLINNSNTKIEKIFDEIINFRKGKKIEGLVIFNIIFTISSFLIGFASLVVGIIGILK